MLTETPAPKRKAEEEPSSPSAAKRIKQSESAEPEKKQAMKPIPFPEKVRPSPLSHHPQPAS